MWGTGCERPRTEIELAAMALSRLGVAVPGDTGGLHEASVGGLNLSVPKGSVGAM
jgi:hypothetical protein